MNWPTCTFLMLLASPALGHDWYLLLRDTQGAPCCGANDCVAVDLCTLGDGRQGMVLPLGCTAIDWPKVLPLNSPDGRAHVCMGVALSGPDHGHDTPAQRVQRCVILPGAV